MNKQDKTIVPIELIESKIYVIRGNKVMIDRDIARLYAVETKVLNQAVKRNHERFPMDFMFQLTKIELKNWKSQIVTSNQEKMGIRKLPTAFTEQGVAMLAGVLNSKRAILVNIEIIRAFTKLRRMISKNQSLKRDLEAMELRYDKQFKIVFDAIRKLIDPEEDELGEIGFQTKT